MWTRPGRGYHARQANLEAEPRPSPKHRTLRLPNDDHGEIHMSADWLLLSSAFIRVQPPAPYVLAQYFRFLYCPSCVSRSCNTVSYRGGFNILEKDNSEINPARNCQITIGRKDAITTIFKV